VIVVADTSVLLNLCRVGEAGLLKQLYQKVWIPVEVQAEFDRLAKDAVRFKGLQLPSWIQQRAASAPMPQVIESADNLDPGETAALALAFEIQADAILLDERKAREVALKLKLKAIGILGILIQAKRAGYVGQICPILDRLQAEAFFWVAPALREEVLRSAGE